MADEPTTPATVASPTQLQVLAWLAGIQGAVMIGYVVVDIVLAVFDDQANWGAVSFLVTLLGLWGVGLFVSARGLLRRRRWAFTPIVFTQLIFGAIALTVIGKAEPQWKAVWAVILVAAVVALVLAFSRPVREAITGPR